MLDQFQHSLRNRAILSAEGRSPRIFDVTPAARWMLKQVQHDEEEMWAFLFLQLGEVRRGKREKRVRAQAREAKVADATAGV
ncbi:hypothetical protein ASE00_16980 [Sphingomonas sp. Root710]|uniref:hypothetical protein n=1 Tax=Sphingomonas sp. Root710 TaxID=1736594 RepID=UPI0007000036|nr:hypothetical protein [Sphingomonas sp. Root710]KRB80726.1 hypothetical protein ASE00_16980 [Sphingomonas sp. Root710]